MNNYIRYSLAYLANISPKILEIISFVLGLWLILGQTFTSAASITVSPPKLEFEVDKGQTISQVISITNGEDADLVLSTSVSDFTASGESGEASFTEENQGAFSLSSWISLPTSTITVPSKARVEMPFTVRIPANAESGGHFGTVFFSPISTTGGDIAIKQKVGVLLLVKVKGEIKEQGTLDIFNAYSVGIDSDNIASAKSQSIFEKFPINLTVRLTNTGNVHNKPQGKIVLKNSFGQILNRVGEEAVLSPTRAITSTKLVDYLPVNDKGGNVLPGSSRVFLQTWKGYGSINYTQDSEKEIVWKGLGFGRYTAELELSYAGQNFPKQVIYFWILPWKIIGTTLIALIALFFILKKWRRVSRERLKRKLRREIERERR